MTTIGVVIPVGPMRIFTELLVPTLRALRAQTHLPAHVVIVDDMAGIAERAPSVPGLVELLADDHVFVHRTPWQLGAAASLNVGIALSEADVAVLVAPGDLLQPGAVRALELAEGDGGSWWWFSAKPLRGFRDAEVRMATLEGPEWTPAAVRRDLWKFHGGFPVCFPQDDPQRALLLKVLADEPQNVHRVPDDAAYGQHWHRDMVMWWLRPEALAEWGRFGP